MSAFYCGACAKFPFLCFPGSFLHNLHVDLRIPNLVNFDICIVRNKVGVEQSGLLQ